MLNYRSKMHILKIYTQVKHVINYFCIYKIYKSYTHTDIYIYMTYIEEEMPSWFMNIWIDIKSNFPTQVIP